MLRTYLYIPDHLNKEIGKVAKEQKKSKAAVIREALEKGLEPTESKTNSAQALLDLAEMAKRIPTKGKVPKDFSINMDYYTWGGEKRE